MIPDDLMTKAVQIKTILRFTPEDKWAEIIGRGLLDERTYERERSKAVVREIMDLKQKENVK